MKHRKSTKTLALFLSLIMALSSIPFAATAVGEYTETDGRYLIANTQTKIAPGITENKIITNDESGNAQAVAYAVTVDTSNPTVAFKAGYADYSGEEWKMQTVRDQAKAYENSPDTEGKIVVAVNADIYNMATGEPSGVCVLNGKIVQRGIGKPYFGVTKSGEIVMGGSLTEELLANLQEAVSGFYMIVENGQRVGAGTTPNPSYFVPKTAVGLKADGTAIVVTVDGRNYPVSNGLDDYELASIMLGLGCVDVINLDGGGSTTYLARYEGEEHLNLKDKPSDGQERAVSSSLFVVTTAKASGELDHAAISPANSLYTPSAKIQFSAMGVDSSGANAPLPSDGTFALADESFGEITKDGLFTSSGKLGTVEVNYLSAGAVIGTGSVEIVKPDEISFSSEEVSLGFEAVSDLGLTVKYQSRDVIYTPDDIVWEMTNNELGTINDNIFTSSDGKTLNGNITATSAYDPSVTSTVHVIVGLLPTVVWDFEDVNITDENGNITETIPAADYYTGENGILTHGNYNRGGKESVEIISIDDEEPVRFGSHALKLNYDFTDCGDVTEGAVIGTKDGMPIPGNPTGIGCWVYAPEGTGIKYEGPGTQSGFWLRGYVYDGAGTNKPYDFTFEPKAKAVIDENGNWTGVQPGVYWEGWMYCEADLTKMTGPFSVLPGNTLRFMFVAGTGMGTRTAGEIYFDNLQFVYGTNVDDVDNPIVDSITVNNEELKDGAVIKTNTINVDGYFHDVENKYTTGIDPSTVRMYLDGINVADNDYFQYITDPDGSKNHLYNAYLLNGQHSLTVSVRDGFGNETTETRYFTVDGEASNAPTVSVGTVEDAAVLGKKISISIDASDASVLTNSTGLTFSNQFKDYEVTFGDNFDGTYSYNKLKKTLTVTGTNKGGEGTHIATVSFTVPKTLNASQNFAYTVKSGIYNVGEKFYTYSVPEAKVAVSAPYTVSAKPMLVGMPGTIVVTDDSGNAAQGISVYYGETLVGVTDEKGEIVTDMFTQVSGNYEVFAMDGEGNVSFICKIGSYDINGESLAPFGIMNNAVKDPTTMKAINWISSPQASAQVLQYKAEGAEEWTTVEASSDLQVFTKGGNSAANFNGAVLTGLAPATTYEYRVGSEAAYSDILKFTTAEKTDKTKFFVLGDMQSEDITNISALSDMIAKGSYNFGIQTGDMVDDTTLYSSWVDVTTLLGVEQFGSVDTLHVLGNHEYAGDADGEKSKALYSLPESSAGSAYSVTYGNVYVAAINYSGNINEYKAALDWVVEDAKASDATWKVLTLHQPAYFTNNVGGNGDVHALVPPAVDKAGIDVVFSGHDHSYARTAPMTGGEVNEDGAVYFICGSSGEKKYDITNNDAFNFEIATQDYDGVYLSVETTKHTFDVKTYNADGTLLDSYTKHSQCVTNGHEWVYDSATDKVICSVCGDANDDYSGFITVPETGKNMYYLNGEKQTGWLTYGEECYYFDENGLGVSGELTIDGIPYKFNEDGSQDGYVFHKDSDGYTRCYRGGVFAVGWREIDGKLYFFTSADGARGAMYTGIRTIYIYTGQAVTYYFARDGHLLKGTFYDLEDGRVYYWGPTAVTGWREIDGKKYYFDLSTSYMVTGEVEIDGAVYAFGDDGVFLHDGAHSWKTITSQKGSCVDDEELVLICKECSYSKKVTNKAPGHVDADKDGKCDVCNKGADSGSSLGFSSIFTRIYAWFNMLIAKIKYFFKHI